MARSSTEAEYKGFADVAAKVTWVVSILNEIGLSLFALPALWCDNLGATHLCANSVFHARTKHIEVNYHFVRNKVASGDLKVRFVSTQDQVADIFSKLLSVKRFEFLLDKLNVLCLPP